MVDVRLAGDFLVLGCSFVGRALILQGHLAKVFFSFGQLDFYVTERIFQFTRLDLTEAQHLFVLVFSAVLPVNSKSFASNTVALLVVGVFLFRNVHI